MTLEALRENGVATKPVYIELTSKYLVLVDPAQHGIVFEQDLLRCGYSAYPLSNIVAVHDFKGVSNIPHKMVTFGSDPELFVIDKSAEVIPSPAVITHNSNIVKPDGFQIELNPSTSTCRQSASSYIEIALNEARDMAVRSGYDLSFKVGHIISESVWKQVGSTLKRFGCNPTLNVHEKSFKRVTGLREKFRAGGGHIHLGIVIAKENVTKLVTLMDIIAGNTCVLIDRDPDNARRRTNYGRAGEYRLKSYGLEYRVLSNFWLKKYLLWSMATGLLRNAYSLVHNQALSDELISRFNLRDIRDAINNNDKELAMKNFMILRDFIKEKKVYFGTGLSFNNIDAFLDWASVEDPVTELNVDTTEKIMQAWRRQGHDYDGLEVFLSQRKINKLQQS